MFFPSFNLSLAIGRFPLIKLTRNFKAQKITSFPSLSCANRFHHVGVCRRMAFGLIAEKQARFKDLLGNQLLTTTS
jgi:hypothetical protein